MLQYRSRKPARTRNSWHEQFGNGSGLVAKGDFISSEMRQGIERIVEIEKSSPKISDV